MQRTEMMLKMRGVAVMAAAGCFLGFGTPARACSGPTKPNYMAVAAANMAKMLIPAGRPTGGNMGTSESKVADSAQSHAPSIVGLWHTSYLSGGVVVDEGFEAWHSDGTEILIDIAPPATDNVCIGVWAQIGTLDYSLTHPSWTFDEMGNLTGTAMILVSLTLSHDGNSFTGNFTINTADVNGVPNGHYQGQVKSTRIVPQ